MKNVHYPKHMHQYLTLVDKSARTPAHPLGYRVHTQFRQTGGRKKKNGCRLADRSDIRFAAEKKDQVLAKHHHAKVFKPVQLSVDSDWLKQIGG